MLRLKEGLTARFLALANAKTGQEEQVWRRKNQAKIGYVEFDVL